MMVVPAMSKPKAAPSHSKNVLRPATVSCVKSSRSYIVVVAAKKAPMSSTPMQRSFMTEVSRETVRENAAANSAVPFLRTRALHALPGALGLGVISLSLGRSTCLVGRLDDELRDVGGTRKHGHMAGRQHDRLRVHRLGEFALKVRLDHPVVARDDVPRGFGLPGGVRHLAAKGGGVRRPLSRGQYSALLHGKILCEAFDDALGRDLEEARGVRPDFRASRSRGKLLAKVA